MMRTYAPKMQRKIFRGANPGTHLFKDGRRDNNQGGTREKEALHDRSGPSVVPSTAGGK